MPREVVTESVEQTEEVAAELGRTLGAGAVVLLYGELGMGKTAFVRGLARGLDASPDEVSSPTFTIAQHYAGRVPVAHVDLYRVTPAEVGELGLEDLGEGAVMAIEWADRLPARPEGAIEVTLADEGGDRRRLTIRGETASDRTPSHSAR